MKEDSFFQQFFQLAVNAWRIRKYTPDNSLKRSILAANSSLFFPGRLKAENGLARIAGCTVRYGSARLLRVLFDEIFIRQEYAFSSGTDRPFIIDCGSNIGMSVLYFKLLYPQAQILAFEPAPDTFSYLERNVQENALAEVVIHQAALYDREGTVDFYYDENDPGLLMASTVQKRMPKQVQPVPCTVLSKFIDRQVDLLKIDIEGAEMIVLDELYQADRLQFVKQIVLEYHHHIHQDADELSRILSLLEQAGFGYQVESSMGRPLTPGQFQDVFLYAYQKRP